MFTYARDHAAYASSATCRIDRPGSERPGVPPETVELLAVCSSGFSLAKWPSHKNHYPKTAIVL